MGVTCLWSATAVFKFEPRHVCKGPRPPHRTQAFPRPIMDEPSAPALFIASS